MDFISTKVVINSRTDSRQETLQTVGGVEV